MISDSFCLSTHGILVCFKTEFLNTLSSTFEVPLLQSDFFKSHARKKLSFFCLKLVLFLKIQKILIYWNNNLSEMDMYQFNTKNAMLVSWNSNKVHKFSPKTPLECIEKVKRSFFRKKTMAFPSLAVL